jgi:hypothetical protein
VLAEARVVVKVDELPGAVRSVTDAYLSAVDRLTPGFIVGLHLTGSVALGDFRDGRSDIDFVAVHETAADPEALAALEEVHAEVRARFPAQRFDGIYLTPVDLTLGPDRTPEVPYHHDGRFHAAGRFNRSPIIWHELADHAVTLRGPKPADRGVWTDQAALRAWCRDNLVTYWRPWAHRVWHPGDLPVTASLRLAEVEWAVLGVSRLHATITTGRILTKAAGGAYARDRFGAPWHDLIDAALRIRAGEARLSDRAGVLGLRRRRRAFVAMVIADATAP